MGITLNKKKISQTIVLTEPVLTTSGETVNQSVPKQTLHGAVIRDKNAPLYIRKINTWAWENAQHHNTNKFTLPKLGVLVVRRGQPFKLTLTFNRPYDSLKDELRFYFETGDKPLPGNDTMVCMSSYTSQGSSGWKSDFMPIVGTKNRDGMSANLWIFTPADCIVSDWRFSLHSILRSESDTATVTYNHPDRIYILFNPWSKLDAVYLPPKPMLEEYILNSSGVIFTGCNRKMTVKPWIYGHFESGILEACMYIIKRGFNFRASQSMGDPVAVSRSIAFILNGDVPCNGGVLQSTWSTSDITDGRSPTMWSGSVSILKQYLERVIDSDGKNPEPIKYGQCFVYAGLVTTICRAIGIPSRCVTSYNTGSGTDGRLAVDCYYEVNEDGTLEKLNDTDNEDFIWNFHVWNDVWMKRLDLESPCNEAEWQALDATPNITGNGMLSCGPAPHYALKNGLTELKHDTGTIFAKINADIIEWLKLDMGDWTVFKVYSSRLGQSVSTKTPDGRPARLTFKYNLSELSRIRQDITSDYKYKKGTKLEREIVQRPARIARPMHHCKMKDTRFTLEDKEYEDIGADFNVKVNISNLSTEDRTLHVILVCESVQYNGRTHCVIKQQQWTVTLPAGESKQFILGVYESDYRDKLTEHTVLRQVGYLNVQETEQIEAYKQLFLLMKPHLELKVEEPVYKNTNFALKITFTNPLARPLTNCTLSVEGAGLESMTFIRQFKNVAARCEWTGIVNLMPVKSKSIELSATFHCREMFDIVGFTVIKVDSATRDELTEDIKIDKTIK